MHYRPEAPGPLGMVEQPDKREDAIRNTVEQPAVEQLNACEKIGGHLVLAAVARFSGRVEKIIAAALIPDCGYRPLQQQDRIHMIGIEFVSEAQQGVILAVEPEYVAVHDEKCVVEQWQGAFNATARVEELGFLRDLDARSVAAAELCGNHPGLVVDVDYDPLDPDERQPVDCVIEQGTAVYLDERFRNSFGHRAQPRTKPGCQHHPRKGWTNHAEPRASGTWRASRG